MTESGVDWNFVIFLITQSVVIVGTILTAYLNLKIAIAKLELGFQHVDEFTMEMKKELKGDHEKLVRKVDGISKHVANIEGQLGVET